MKINISLLLPASSLACAALEKKTNPTACHADNCLRELRATSVLSQASIDCSSFLLETITPPPVTVTITSTLGGPDKRDSTLTSPSPAISTYASQCTNATAYASACSCIGVTASTTTLTPSSTTVIVTATPAPSCTGQTCTTGFAATCNSQNSQCFCFTNSAGTGFCGQNAPCAGLTNCNSDTDCAGVNSTGDTCALHTCCGDAGICLEGTCPNPSARLRRMAKDVARNHLGADTAAFRGH